MPDKFTLILDSSQIDTLYTCMVKWDFINNKKLYKLNPDGIESPPSQAILGGTYGHKLLEVYDRVVMETGGDTTAAMKYMWSREWLKWDTIKGSRFFKDSEEYERFESDLALIEPARRSLVEARATGSIMRFAINPYQVLSVETGFSYPLYEDSDNLFILEGRFDAIIQIGDNKYFLDHKFQDRAHNLYRKRIQFRNYALVSGCNTGLVNYIRLNQKEDISTYKRDTCPFSTDELQSWKEELIRKYFHVKDFMNRITAPESEWRNRAACDGVYNQECWFTQLCDETNNELVQIRIDQNYGKREKMWRPW